MTDTSIRQAHQKATRSELNIPAGTTARILASVAVALSLASLTVQVVLHTSGDPNAEGTLIRLSDLNSEESLATWFSSSLLGLSSVLLFAIAHATRRNGGRYVAHWAVLSALFFYLCIDEAVAIHEATIRPLSSAGVGGSGLLYYSWVVPGLALTGFLTLAYLRFLLALPPPTRPLFLIAASLFVGGALGVELIGGWAADQSGDKTLTYQLLVTAEESLEMAGVITFLYALMGYLALHVGELRARFSLRPFDTPDSREEGPQPGLSHPRERRGQSRAWTARS